MSAWFWIGLIVAVLGLVTWGLAAWARPGPTWPEDRGRGQVEPRVAVQPPTTPRRHVCMECSHLQHIDDAGRLVDHDRPEPTVPFDTTPVHCEGSGRTA
jgi:hypothetical protein